MSDHTDGTSCQVPPNQHSTIVLDTGPPPEARSIVDSDAATDVSPLLASSARDVVARAVEVSDVLKDIIQQRKLSEVIAGRRYVKAEGWQTLGAMCGIVPRKVSVTEECDGTFVAVVELVRLSDQAIVGRASAMLTSDEANWKNRPRYARRSMCVTRAVGKAFRLSLAWIVRLAGYEPSVAEEMPRRTRPRGKPPPNSKPITVDAAHVAPADSQCTAAQHQQIRDLVQRLNLTQKEAVDMVRRHGAEQLGHLSVDQADRMIRELETKVLETEAPF